MSSKAKLIEDDAFIIADTHFGHQNIISYANRPFKTVKEMDEALIDNWNRAVGKKDQVVFLGDFAFADSEKTRSYYYALNGRIIFMMGNHDRGRSYDWWREIFNVVLVDPIVYKDFFILSHEPIEWVSERLPVCNIHGHVHEKTHYGLQNHHYNVSVEAINYTPMRLWTILEVCKQLSDGSALMDVEA